MVVLASISCCAAKEFYIAQNAAGANNGADCKDAYSAAWFNSASNWGSGTNQISPGTVVHLCGTFSAAAGACGYLSFQGSGSDGSPITLLFEKGAVLTAPYWGMYGAVYANHNNYLVVDGGTDGVVNATANGTGLTYQKDGSGVYMGGSSHSEIRNLTIANIYVHSGMSDFAGQDSYGLNWTYGSNVSIHDLVIHDAKWCIQYGWAGSATTSNADIFKNEIYDCDHGIAYGDGNTNAVMTGTNQVYGNTIHDGVNWDDSQDVNHHDGIHVWTAHPGSTVSIQVFNNFIYGDWGIHQTADIYFDGLSAPGSFGITGTIFNNLLVNSAAKNAPDDSMIFVWSTNSPVYNNTIVAPASAPTVAVSTYAPGLSFQNNILSGVAMGLYIYANGDATGSLAVSDHNVFYNVPTIATIWGKATYTKLTDWQGSSGQPDSHSTTSDPLLDGNYKPQAGSSAIGLGANFAILGINPLDYDFVGNPRPKLHAARWDSGVYESARTHDYRVPSGLMVSVR